MKVFNQIVLSEDEKKLAIYKYSKANGIYDMSPEQKQIAIENEKERKYYIKVVNLYFKKINQKIVFPLISPEVFNKIIIDSAKLQIKNFELDKITADFIKKMSIYFTDNQLGDLDKDKGLLILGNIGCGKTTLFKLFKENPKESFVINSSRDISNSYAEKGMEVISRYSSLGKSTFLGRKYGNNNSLGLMIDDLGIEETRGNFGNKSNVIAEIILNRYDAGLKIHGSTNLSMQQLTERYGERALSRLREMCNIVVYPTLISDRRK